MAITIRAKDVEDAIRALQKRDNKGPTDILRDLIRLREEREAAEQAARIEKRRLALQALVDEARRSLTDADRAAIRAAMDDLYDENGLPK
jgi:hypothetical protein